MTRARPISSSGGALRGISGLVARLMQVLPGKRTRPGAPAVLRGDAETKSPRFVVHIGMGKTGTTSIQRFLYENRAALLDQGLVFERFGGLLTHQGLAILALDGFDWPDNFARAAQAHLRDDAKLKAMAIEARATVERMVRNNPGQPCIFSSEQLTGWLRSEETLAALHTFLSEHAERVDYVIYIRRPEDWIASAYSQHLRAGGTTGLDAFVEKRKEVNLWRLLNRWSDMGDNASLTVRLFQRDRLVDGDVVRDLCSVAGIDTTRLAFADPANESFSAAAAEILRLANERLPFFAANPDRTHPLRRRLNFALLNLSQGHPKLRLNQAQVDEVRQVNARDLRRIRKRYFPDEAELFPPKAPPPKNADTSTAEEQLAVALDLFHAACLGDLPTLPPDTAEIYRRPIPTDGSNRPSKT